LTPDSGVRFSRPMHDQNMAIIKGLVSVAWADGRVAQEEVEVIEALLDAFEAAPSEAREIREYAKTPKGIDDIPLTDLSYDDRRVLLQHAVLLTFIDGEQDPKERELLDQLCEKLRIPSVEARGIIDAASERAKKFLNML
jgi:tellurite resistance protein